MNGGRQIVLTAPFTEMIDPADYFIQMGMASIPTMPRRQRASASSPPPSVVTSSCWSDWFTMK